MRSPAAISTPAKAEFWARRAPAPLTERRAEVVRYLCTRGSRETFVNGKKSDIFIVLCLTITNRSVGLLAQSAQTKNHGGARLPVSSGVA
jgi:hypothetical protein